MSSLYRRIELLSNIAIIVVALLLGVVLVKKYFAGSPPATNTREISAGTKIALTDVDWSKSRQTILIVLSQRCHFCSESMPFYQRLTQEVKDYSDTRLIAVLPQPPGEGQKYLDNLGLAIKDVKQAELSSIQVRGTPTLILVDSRGVVTDVWVGKLSSDKETEVISKVECDTCGS
jgi:thioredoxin-related protein